MGGVIDVVGFDGDDTLWHNESVFSVTHDRFRELLAPYADGGLLDERLYATEMANLRLFGYGVKAFTLSMIETAIDLSGGRIAAGDIARIIDAGKNMLAHPVDLLPGVESTLDAVAEAGYQLMLITKGDLFDQEAKLARSGLAGRFWRVAVVARKDTRTYRKVLADHFVDASGFVMVGNSVPSDVLPVLEVGGRAVHVPYPLTWAHEHAEPVLGDERVWNVGTIDEVPAVSHPGSRAVRVWWFTPLETRRCVDGTKRPRTRLGARRRFRREVGSGCTSRPSR
jgi:putative hydrolase of the HAD superfamily